MLQKHPPTHPTPVEGKIHLVNFFDDPKEGPKRITQLVAQGTTIPGKISRTVRTYLADPKGQDQIRNRHAIAIKPETGQAVHSRSRRVVGTELAQRIVATLASYFSDPKTADERIRNGIAFQREDVDEILNGPCPCRVMSINIEESNTPQLREELFVVIYLIDPR